jgi:hypothetical protein
MRNISVEIHIQCLQKCWVTSRDKINLRTENTTTNVLTLKNGLNIWLYKGYDLKKSHKKNSIICLQIEGKCDLSKSAKRKKKSQTGDMTQ